MRGGGREGNNLPQTQTPTPPHRCRRQHVLLPLCRTLNCIPTPSQNTCTRTCRRRVWTRQAKTLLFVRSLMPSCCLFAAPAGVRGFRNAILKCRLQMSLSGSISRDSRHIRRRHQGMPSSSDCRFDVVQIFQMDK